MIPVEALLFDLDGTLVDSGRDLAASVQFVQKSLKISPSSTAEVASFVGDGVIRLIQRAMPQLRGSSFDDAVSRFKKYYAIHCLDHTRLYPGVADMLHHFREKKLAVITNKPARMSRRILEGLGVLSHLDLVLGEDSLRYKKPNPEVIVLALKALKVRHLRMAVVIGDSRNDILAGRGAGTYTCGILSNFGNPETLRASRPDLIFLNTTETMRYFN